jgi:CxxC motif-containing protein
MLEKQTITCVACPKGCEVTVEHDGDEIIDIMGNACPQGADYAKEEIVAPTRILPTTVRVKNGALPLCPVKTTKQIPLEMIHDAMEIIGEKEVEAPVKLGQVIVENILDSGADVVATRDLPKKIHY